MQLDVTNHPTGGPVISGPQLQPWICTTQNHGLGAAARCAIATQPPQFAFFYKNATTAQFARLRSRQSAASGADRIDHDGSRSNCSVYRSRGDGRSEPIDLQDHRAFRSRRSRGPHGRRSRRGTARWCKCSAPEPERNTRKARWPTRLTTTRLARGFATTAASADQPRDDFQHEAQRRDLDDGEGAPRGSLRADPLHHRAGLFGRRDPAAQHRRPVSGLLDGMLPNCSYPDIWSLYVASHDCQLFTRYFTALSPALWTNVAGSSGGHRAQFGTGMPGAGRTSCIRYPLLRRHQCALPAPDRERSMIPSPIRMACVAA